MKETKKTGTIRKREDIVALLKECFTRDNEHFRKTREIIKKKLGFDNKDKREIEKNGKEKEN